MEILTKDCLFLIYDKIHIIELLKYKEVSAKFKNSIEKYIIERRLETLLNSFKMAFKEQKTLMVSLVDIAMLLNLTDVLDYSQKKLSLKNKTYPISNVSIENDVFCFYGINHAIRLNNINSIKWYIENYKNLRKSNKLKSRGMLSKGNIEDILSKTKLADISLLLQEKYKLVLSVSNFYSNICVEQISVSEANSNIVFLPPEHFKKMNYSEFLSICKKIHKELLKID